MADNTVSIIITGDGRKFDEAITKSGRNIKTFGDRTIDTFRRVGRTIQHVGDRVMTPFTSIASGAGIVMAAKSVIDFDARLARLAIQAGKSTKDMMALKKTLFDIGDATYQTPEDLLASMEQIIEKTGNFDLAVGSLRDMGITASASAASLQDIGALTSNLNEKFGITKTEMKGAFDILIEQGKTGAFTLMKMAGLGERLFTAAASWGMKGKQSLRDFGAFLQIVKTGTGNEEQATTAVERTFADLIQNYKKVKALAGVSIFDPVETKKQGRAVTRDFAVVMKEIITRTKGDQVKLRQIFGDESIRAVNAMARSYQDFGDFRVFDDLVKRGGDGTAMMKDFAAWTTTTAAQLNNFRIQLSKFANENLAGPIKALTESLDYLNKHPVIMKGGLYTILGLGGVLAAGKTFGFISDAIKMLTGKTGGKGSGIPGMPTGLGRYGMPVYITNWEARNQRGIPMGPSSLPGTTSTAGGAGPGWATGAGRVMSSTGAMGGIAALTVGTAIFSAVDIANGGTGKNWMSDALDSVLKVAYGDNKTVGDRVYDAVQDFKSTFTSEYWKQVFNISVNVDQNGRTVVTSDKMNANVRANIDTMNRGQFGVPGK